MRRKAQSQGPPRPRDYRARLHAGCPRSLRGMQHSSQTPHKHPNHRFVYPAAPANTFMSFRLLAVIALTKLQMHGIVKKASPTNADPSGQLSRCPRQPGNEYVCTVTPATAPHPVPRLPRQSRPAGWSRGEPETAGRGGDGTRASPRRRRAPRRAPGPAPAAPLTPAAGRSWWRRAAAPRGSARGPRGAAGRGPRAAAASAPLPGHGHAVTPRGGAGPGLPAGRERALRRSGGAARPGHPSPASRTNGKPRGTHVGELCACWDKRDVPPPPRAAPPQKNCRRTPSSASDARAAAVCRLHPHVSAA